MNKIISLEDISPQETSGMKQSDCEVNYRSIYEDVEEWENIVEVSLLGKKLFTVKWF